MTTGYSTKFKSQGYLVTKSFPISPASNDTSIVSVFASSNQYDLLVQSYSKAGTATVTWSDQAGPQSVTVTVESQVGAGRIALPGSPNALGVTPDGIHVTRD